jgi:putative membrane protein
MPTVLRILRGSIVLIVAILMIKFTIIKDPIFKDPFFNNASLTNIEEIEAGKLAVNKGNSEVINIGKQMVADHTQAENELIALAKKRDEILVTTLDSEYKKELNILSNLSGKSFDSAYMVKQFLEHKKEIALFSEESKSGIDPQAKTYAGKYLPKWQMHLQMFQDNGAAMKTTMDSVKKKK